MYSMKMYIHFEIGWKLYLIIVNEMYSYILKWYYSELVY